MIRIRFNKCQQIAYRNSKTGRHSVEVVGVLAHGHDFGNDGFVGPLDAEYLGELLEILSGGLTDGENGITEPAHAKTAQLLIEEFYAELRGQEGDVFDDGEAHAPLLVLGKLDDCWEEGLREKLNANHFEKLVSVSSGNGTEQTYRY